MNIIGIDPGNTHSAVVAISIRYLTKPLNTCIMVASAGHRKWSSRMELKSLTEEFDQQVPEKVQQAFLYILTSDVPDMMRKTDLA